MKKISIRLTAICLLAAALLTALCGCQPAAESTNLGSFSPKDVELVYRGLTVHVDENVAPLLDKLGDDFTYSESISCNYAENGVDGMDGMDKFYDFADVSVTTCPLIPGADYITSIEVWKSAGWTTSKGIGIGSTLADIEAVYGNGYIADSGMYIYYADLEDPTSSQLYFIIEDGVVSIFGIA